MPSCRCREQAHRTAVERRARRRRSRLTEARARHDALEQLQSRVQQSGKLGDWLKRHGLDGERRRCGRASQVEAGWETAVEAVLRERLGAIALDDEARIAALLGDPPPANAAWRLRRCACRPPSIESPAGERARAPRCTAAMPHWRGGARRLAARRSVAEMLAAALRPPPRTGAGRMLGRARRPGAVARTGCRFYAPDERTHGVHRAPARDRRTGSAGSPRLEAEAATARSAAHEAEAALADSQDEAAEHRPAHRPGSAAARCTRRRSRCSS